MLKVVLELINLDTEFFLVVGLHVDFFIGHFELFVIF